MSLYASGTVVPVERSRAEIERILTRYGATGFLYGWEGLRAVVGFQMRGRRVKFVLPIPDRKDFRTSPAGRHRTESSIQEAHLAEIRRRWRALCLAIKAKLEVVESGIVDFDTEFLAYLVAKDGQTVGEHVMAEMQDPTSRLALPPAQQEAAHARHPR